MNATCWYTLYDVSDSCLYPSRVVDRYAALIATQLMVQRRCSPPTRLDKADEPGDVCDAEGSTNKRERDRNIYFVENTHGWFNEDGAVDFDSLYPTLTASLKKLRQR